VGHWGNARQVIKLIGNGMRYRRLRASGKPYRLESLSLEITHRCICRCSMCNIWQIPPEVPDLELSIWQELLCSPELYHLREMDLTGGEPFLRRDVDKLLQAICDVQPTHFPGLRTLAITTNGILTDRILGLSPGAHRTSAEAGHRPGSGVRNGRGRESA
jgi:MoaA/NifB/PqqE/SkfB family radical SAM enzyme